MPRRTHRRVQHHARRDSHRDYCGTGANSTVRYGNVGDFRGEHHRKQSQYQDSADVNEQLHHSYKVRGQQNVDTHYAHERAEQGEGRIDNVAGECDHQRRAYSQRGERVENRLCKHRFALFPECLVRVSWPRALSWIVLGRLFAAGLRPLIEVGHAAIQNRHDSRIGFRPLFGLVGNHRILDEAANQAFQRIVSALKLGRVMNRTGRAWLAAEPAVHALGYVDIELREQHLARLRILVYDNDYAINRTCALAGETSSADFEIDFQYPAIAERQRVLHPHRHPVWILNRVGLAQQMRRGHGHPFENRGDRIFYILCVFGNCAHRAPLYSRIEVNFHPRTLEIVDNTLDEHYCQRDSAGEHDIAHCGIAVGPNRDPDRGANQVHERYWHEVFPADGHQLIDPDARQRRTNP